MLFPGLTIFMVFILYYAFRRRQIERRETERETEFWSRENRALNTRSKDLSNLEYITVPLETFPMGLHSEEDLIPFEEKLQQLSQEKIYNLTGISNTDLMLTYGAGNLDTLSSYDENYTQLVRTIADYGEALASHSYTEDAITVLEYGIKIRSDVISNYTLLASLYQETGEDRKIRSLLETAKILNSLSKDVILEKLEELNSEN